MLLSFIYLFIKRQEKKGASKSSSSSQQQITEEAESYVLLIILSSVFCRFLIQLLWPSYCHQILKRPVHVLEVFLTNHEMVDHFMMANSLYVAENRKMKYILTCHIKYCRTLLFLDLLTLYHEK